MFTNVNLFESIILFSFMFILLLFDGLIIYNTYAITTIDSQTEAVHKSQDIIINEDGLYSDTPLIWDTKKNTNNNSINISNNHAIVISQETSSGSISLSSSSFKESVKDTGCSVERIIRNIGNNYTDLTGTDENDLLISESKDEKISAKKGDDIVQSGGGKNLIFGNDGKDKLQGGSAEDSIFGEEGDDIITAGSGDDYLCGGSGDDILYSEAGNDILEGGSGADFFDCGDGIDIVLDFSLSKGDIINTNCESR